MPVHVVTLPWWPLPALVDLFILIRQVRATCLHKLSHSSWCDRLGEERPITPRKKEQFLQNQEVKILSSGVNITPTHIKRMHMRMTLHESRFLNSRVASADISSDLCVYFKCICGKSTTTLVDSLDCLNYAACEVLLHIIMCLWRYAIVLECVDTN